MDRYFEAETTLKEEQILKAFFEQSEEELPENLRAYRELFTSFEQDEMLGDDFDERMLQMIEEKPQVKARTISLSERFRPLMRAAAVVAILITLTTALNQSFKDDKVWTDQSDYALKYEATGDEPAMAYDHSTDSLVSDSLYKPTGYLE
jgi:hypothetical protein